MPDAGINWFAIVGSSAVIAAFISTTFNVAFGAWAKHSDRRREDAKEAKKAGHVYLGVALSLEAFSKRCADCIDDIEAAFEQMYEQNSREPLANLKTPKMLFEPEPTWNELPIAFVARVKGLVSQHEERSKWIGQQFLYWAELDDAYAFEKELAAVYGLRASELAAEIRLQIKAGPVESSPDQQFYAVVSERRRSFSADRRTTFIPELKHLFEGEAPSPIADLAG